MSDGFLIFVFLCGCTILRKFWFILQLALKSLKSVSIKVGQKLERKIAESVCFNSQLLIIVITSCLYIQMYMKWPKLKTIFNAIYSTTLSWSVLGALVEKLLCCNEK